MASLAQKLGLKPGQTICLLDATAETAQVIRAACAEDVGGDVTIAETLDGAPVSMIFYWPREIEGLEGRFAALQRQIVSNGAIWVVLPKKTVAQRRGLTLTWEEMQGAALTTDLVDNKNASMTGEEYGTRFVIRRERRA
jgi:16S rRNA G1207 methylase RsmC